MHIKIYLHKNDEADFVSVSVEITPAVLGITVARNFFTFVFMVEMVVVGYLLSGIYVSFGKKYNLFAMHEVLLNRGTTSNQDLIVQADITFFSVLTDITLATQFGCTSNIDKVRINIPKY